MIANILAVIFLLKLSSKTHLNALNFVASYYGNDTKLLLRQLEPVLRKLTKCQADVEFLQMCATYAYRFLPKFSVCQKFLPKFIRFKLYKKERKTGK